MKSRVAIIARKSPGRKKEESIKKQVDICKEQAIKDLGENLQFYVFADIGISGDDEQGRKELYKFFKDINDYRYAYCLDVDRFSRSFLGMYWFRKFFVGSTCILRFVNGPRLYRDNGEYDPDGYLHFSMLCVFAEHELICIRRRTSIGRERARENGIKLGQENIMEKNPELCKAILKDRETMSYSKLATKYGLSRSLVWKIVNVYKLQTSCISKKTTK